MRCDKKDLLLYGVTDRSWLGDRTLAQQVEASLRGGATMIQLREKHMDRGSILAQALELRELCGRYGVPLILNDDAELAQAAGADGVHVGQSDMEAGRVRALLGEDKLIGVSARTVEQALAAQAAGADYLGVGAMFPTGTKQDTRPVSYDTLKAICAAVDIPVVAIGGIGAGNVAELAGSGIAGVAVVSALYAQPDVEAATRSLRAQVERVVGPGGSRGPSSIWTGPSPTPCTSGTRRPRLWSGSLEESRRRTWPGTSGRWGGGKPRSTWWIHFASPVRPNR